MIYVNSLQETVYVTTEDDTVIVTTESGSPSQAALQFQDEGLNLGTKGTVETVNFVGAGVTVTRTEDELLVTISSGGTGDVVGPASAVSGNLAIFSGTTGKLIADGGAVPSLTNVALAIPFLVVPNAAQAITNQPVAETFFLSSSRHVHRVDGTKYTAARLVAQVTVLSGSVNTPRLYAKWKTTPFDPASTLVADFTTLGTGSGSEACSLAAVAFVATDWITLPAGAKADVYWAVAEIGGDAAADPSVSVVDLHFRI